MWDFVRSVLSPHAMRRDTGNLEATSHCRPVATVASRGSAARGTGSGRVQPKQRATAVLNHSLRSALRRSGNIFGGAQPRGRTYM